MMGYYKDKFDWYSDLGKFIKGEFEKLKKDYSEEKLKAFMNTLINTYLKEAPTETSYHINVANMGNTNENK